MVYHQAELQRQSQECWWRVVAGHSCCSFLGVVLEKRGCLFLLVDRVKKVSCGLRSCLDIVGMSRSFVERAEIILAIIKKRDEVEKKLPLCISAVQKARTQSEVNEPETPLHI